MFQTNHFKAVSSNQIKTDITCVTGYILKLAGNKNTQQMGLHVKIFE